jgi:hypothetical protein
VSRGEGREILGTARENVRENGERKRDRRRRRGRK